MKNKKQKKTMLLLLILLAISIGFALLSTTLKINGTASVKGNTWDIHWENVVPNAQSTVQAQTPTISNNGTTVTYDVELSLPGDYYEFTVDAKNDGSVNGKINDIRHTVKEVTIVNNEEVETTTTLPSYIHATIYYDGTTTAPTIGDILEADKKKTYKVRIEYDSLSETLPEEDKVYRITDEIDYEQTKDEDQSYATFNQGNVVNASFKGLAGNDVSGENPQNVTDTNITSIVRSDTEPSQNVVKENVAVQGSTPIYAWFDNGVIKLYSDANHLALNENASVMFYKLSSVTSVYTNYITTNTTNMSGMFSMCSSIETLNLSNFDTSNVTSMSGMFVGMSSLKTLNVSNFDLTNAGGFISLVGGAGVTPTIENLIMDNVKFAKNSFYSFGGFSNLKTISLKNVDTTNVESMGSMFAECRNLTSLDLSSFNTENVTDMYAMFANCTSITTLDLSSFDTSKVTDMMCMFSGMANLTTIEVSNSFVVNQVTSSASMFDLTTNLVGENGTAYNSSHKDKEYARIDAPGTPGYFTYKSN